MKQKIVVMMIALMALTGATMAQIPNYVPANGLVGWWPFNGNANDESGNGNNGTVSGATLTSDRFGNANRAYNFDGIDDKIELGFIPNSNFSSNSSFSYSLWIKPDGIKFGRILSFTSNVSGDLTFIHQLTYETSGVISFNCAQNTGNVNPPYAQASSQPISANQWYHIVLVYSSNNLTIYINTSGSNSVLYSGPFCIDGVNSQLHIGYIPVEPTERFGGNIDDIGSWNRALTQQEITALYNATNCTPPVATITPGGATTFCQGGSVTLTAGGGGTYAWSNSLGTNASITVSNSGTYTVTVSNGTNCTATASQSVTVNPLPVVNINALPQFVSNNSGAISLSGSPSGGTFAGSGVSGNQFNPSAAGLGSKRINYTYTNTNNCTNSSSVSTIVYDTTGAVCGTYDTLYMRITVTSATPPNNISDMKVYPNPATNHLIVDNGAYSIMTGYSVKITNPLGQVVFNQPITQPKFDIDVSTWPTGTYVLLVLDPQQNIKARKNVVLQ